MMINKLGIATWTDWMFCEDDGRMTTTLRQWTSVWAAAAKAAAREVLQER